MNTKFFFASFIALLLLIAFVSNNLLAGSPHQGGEPGVEADVIVSKPVLPSISPALRDLPLFEGGDPLLDRELNPRRSKHTFLEGPVKLEDTGAVDPLLATSTSNAVTPPINQSWDGISYSSGGTGSPPDTTGDVGLSHYVQSVNGSLQVFTKYGTSLYGPVSNKTLWSGFGGNCETRNDGDPVVLYDQIADRWLISQFTTTSPYMVCVAVSTSNDPTGSYYRYGFQVGSQLPDYFKFGVWPNAYYMSANESSYTAYAFDRTNMLLGQSASYVKFTGQTNFLLPADLDGTTQPASNAPGIFYTFKDDSYHGGSDRIEVYELSPDFTTTSNSTFTKVASLSTSSFTYTVCGFFQLDCIPQPGSSSSTELDAISEWPMFRLAYRNFGTHEALVGNFTVDVGSDLAGIRWFELRDTGSGWSLYQEGTYSPDSTHRFLGSVAQDQEGNIALAYTASSSSTYPSLRYTARQASDTLGTMGSETTIQSGSGSQTSSHSRWGDYSQLTVDPVDDCTFWYTGEYFSSSGSSWKTRIANFRLPDCGRQENSQVCSFRGQFAGGGHGWVTTTFSSSSLFTANTRVVASATENTTEPQIGSARIKVYDVAPGAGSVKVRLYIDWPSNLPFNVNLIWPCGTATQANLGNTPITATIDDSKEIAQSSFGSTALCSLRDDNNSTGFYTIATIYHSSLTNSSHVAASVAEGTGGGFLGNADMWVENVRAGTAIAQARMNDDWSGSLNYRVDFVWSCDPSTSGSGVSVSTTVCSARHYFYPKGNKDVTLYHTDISTTTPVMVATSEGTTLPFFGSAQFEPKSVVSGSGYAQVRVDSNYTSSYLAGHIDILWPCN